MGAAPLFLITSPSLSCFTSPETGDLWKAGTECLYLITGSRSGPGRRTRSRDARKMTKTCLRVQSVGKGFSKYPWASRNGSALIYEQVA